MKARQQYNMKRARGSMAGLAMLLVICLSGGCAKSDPTISVADDDPEMVAAIAKARASLPEFWDAFGRGTPNESDFSLKVAIKDKHRTEHFWLTDLERKDGKVFGTVGNDPDIVSNVKLELLAEVFNLFNHFNPYSYNTNANSAAYGAPTAAGGSGYLEFAPRQLQFIGRISF